LALSSLGESSRLDALFFGESQGRVVVAVQPDDAEALLAVASEVGVEAETLGSVNREGLLRVAVAGEPMLDVPTITLLEVWQNAIPDAMNQA
jgi:phosphoribosylformylglycinamidine (FGAM) synthase-like enzyme